MRVRLVVLASLVIIGVVGGVVAYRAGHTDAVDVPTTAALSPIEDPRTTFDTPFQNVRPDVKYVGDAACTSCHKDHTKHYAMHPMGRSMAPTRPNSATEPIDAKFHNPFEKYGDRFRVEVRDGKVFHVEERLDAKGNAVASIALEAKYEIGSGTRGKSYFVEREGRLFQSPISWYSEKNIWDISPGYPEDYRFNRPVTAKCLVCHCNAVEPAESTINRYEEPVFRGLSIGCERCHGPGEKHVKLRESGERVGAPDYSIVNPKHLSSALGEAVCQQCHLQGEQRVWLLGRKEFDFRPGMPLESFSITFVRKPEFTESFRSVGQFEQMHQSKCYEKSSGKMQCTSCHDPHVRPEPGRRVAFFRERCMKCHQDRGCSSPATERTKKQPDDSCIACHMSKDGSSNIPHTAVTDHRILRTPETVRPHARRSLAPVESPIQPFHGDVSHWQRELGIALAEMTRREEDAAPIFARPAEPLLDLALKARPNDVAAWEAKAQVLRKLGRLPEAMTAIEKVLELQPGNERALIDAAYLSSAVDRTDRAADYWRRVIAINPFVAHHQLELARILALQRNWQEAATTCESAIRVEPLNTELRMLFITALARQGNERRARAEFDTLMAMRPKNEAELRRAFASLTN